MRHLSAVLLVALAGCMPSVGVTTFDPTPRPALAETEVRFTDERRA